MISHNCNLKTNAHKCICKQRQTHRYRKQTSEYQRGEGKGEGKIKDRG